MIKVMFDCAGKKFVVMRVWDEQRGFYKEQVIRIMGD